MIIILHPDVSIHPQISETMTLKELEMDKELEKVLNDLKPEYVDLSDCKMFYGYMSYAEILIAWGANRGSKFWLDTLNAKHDYYNCLKEFRVVKALYADELFCRPTTDQLQRKNPISAEKENTLIITKKES